MNQNEEYPQEVAPGVWITSRTTESYGPDVEFECYVSWVVGLASFSFALGFVIAYMIFGH